MKPKLNNNDALTTLSPAQRHTIMWTLLAIMPIIGMAVDLVAPSLPAIVTALHASPTIIKNVVAIYLLGYALGNFFTGFLTDALGRRQLLRIGLVAFILVSLLPTFFPSVPTLLGARFLQGLTIGVVAVLVRASLSDLLPQQQLVRLGVLIGTMWGIGPVIGPVIGGYLQFYFGWKAGFYFFAGIAALAFIAVISIVPETHFNRQPLNIVTIKNNLTEIVTHRLFMASVIMMGLIYSVIIGFSTVGPFLIQNILHYSPVFFGHLALCFGLVFLLATFVCRYLLRRWQATQLIGVIIHIFLTCAVVSLLISYFLPTSIVLIAVASGLMFFTGGFIFPLSMGVGMSLFRHIAGTATATMYLFNVLITSLASFILSFISIRTATALIWVYVILLALTMTVYWRFVYRARS